VRLQSSANLTYSCNPRESVSDAKVTPQAPARVRSGILETKPAHRRNVSHASSPHGISESTHTVKEHKNAESEKAKADGKA
jgi:hypothetical protein